MAGGSDSVRIMSEIIEVPFPRADSRRLISFLTFQISIFFSASFGGGALILARRQLIRGGKLSEALRTPEDSVSNGGRKSANKDLGLPFYTYDQLVGAKKKAESEHWYFFFFYTHRLNSGEYIPLLNMTFKSDSKFPRGVGHTSLFEGSAGTLR